MELLVKKLKETAQLPKQAKPGDAGLDLYVSEAAVIPPSTSANSFVDVKIGIAVEFPTGFWGRIIGRSSTLRRRGLLVVEGIIDTGYRGELFVGVVNLTSAPVQITVGERLAQLILMENWGNVQVKETDKLSETLRGQDGFGSTGH